MFENLVIYQIFILLVLFQLKHFFADYQLQGKFMLGKFNPDWSFLLPLGAHCLIHALFTLVIVLLYEPSLWWLAIVDFVAHFVMDRLKAGPKYLGRFKDMYHKYFWWSLGFDQMVHHLTHYYIIYKIVTA